MTDYRKISDEDLLIYESLREKEIVYINGRPTPIRRSRYEEYPKAVRHHLSLFPNRFLDRVDLRSDKETLVHLLDGFEKLINSQDTSERDILRYIKEQQAYFIVASILKTGYRFGHHALYVFPEFQLTVNYKPDFLLVGENSDGHHFVFIELENKEGNIARSDGTYGETIRKGITQSENWMIWLESNFDHLQPVFDKEVKSGERWPKEFLKYDSTRMHFVIVAGRRTDFSSELYRRNRDSLKQRSLQILHYDNIIDESRLVLDTGSY